MAGKDDYFDDPLDGIPLNERVNILVSQICYLSAQISHLSNTADLFNRQHMLEADVAKIYHAIRTRLPEPQEGANVS